MDWTQVSTIFGPNMEIIQIGAALFAFIALIWAIRSPFKADINALRSEMHSDINSLRTDTLSLINSMRAENLAFQTEVRGWKEEMHKESKDFHGRLCAIERERK